MNCIVYKDEFSAGRNAYNDLHIGHIHYCVGCGSQWMDRAKPGHVVVIGAKKDGMFYCVIVVLENKLGSCSVWADEGGLKWPYNWNYRPLTEVFTYTENLKSHILSFCEINSLKYKNLFHPRFCSIKLKKAMEELIKVKVSGNQSFDTNF